MQIQQLSRSVGVFAHTQYNYKPQHGVSDYLGAQGYKLKALRRESAARARRERREARAITHVNSLSRFTHRAHI